MMRGSDRGPYSRGGLEGSLLNDKLLPFWRVGAEASIDDGAQPHHQGKDLDHPAYVGYPAD